MEVVFVGQCEVFICLGLLEIISLFFPLAMKLIGPQTGCQFFKNVNFFFTTLPLILLHFFPFGFIIVRFFYILFILIFQLFLGSGISELFNDSTMSLLHNMTMNWLILRDFHSSGTLCRLQIKFFLFFFFFRLIAEVEDF